MQRDSYSLNRSIKLNWSYLGILLSTVFVLPGCFGPHHAAPPLDLEHPYHRLEVVSHRGCHQQAPENSYAAARRCIELGVECVEVDVRQSSDDVFYLMHDGTVDRTTSGTGRCIVRIKVIR
jgi:hypothetical protein